MKEPADPTDKTEERAIERKDGGRLTTRDVSAVCPLMSGESVTNSDEQEAVGYKLAHGTPRGTAFGVLKMAPAMSSSPQSPSWGSQRRRSEFRTEVAQTLPHRDPHRRDSQ